MSDMKYTRGPWQMVPGHSIIQIKSPTQVICAVGSVACYEDFTECDEANARLIASAPELLGALELAAIIIGHPDDDFSKSIAELIAKARSQS